MATWRSEREGVARENVANSSPDADILKHVPTTCYTKIIVTSLILISSTVAGRYFPERSGWYEIEGLRGVVGESQSPSPHTVKNLQHRY